MVVKRTRTGIDITPDEETTKRVVQALFPQHDEVAWNIAVEKQEVRYFTVEELQIAGKKLREISKRNPWNGAEIPQTTGDAFYQNFS